MEIENNENEKIIHEIDQEKEKSTDRQDKILEDYKRFYSLPIKRVIENDYIGC